MPGLCLVLAACSAGAPPDGAAAEAGPVRIDPPAGSGAMAPNLTQSGSGALLSWVEPAAAGAAGHAVRLARLERAVGRWAWNAPRTVATGSDFFVNWADFPSVQEAPGGALVAHWLARSGPGVYAYDVQLARSADAGATWQRLGPAHDDGVQSEHGFVSLVPERDGVRAFWLDGREMAAAQGHEDAGGHGADGRAGGAMTLRAALVRERVGPGELLDARVCECCQTSAAMTSGGPVAVYRDRSESEIRDIWIVRRTDGGWAAPAPVHVDGWEVPGCPVNGPSAASDGGRRLAVAWFTAQGNRPRVQVAFSDDAGARFGPPIVVDDDDPLGRVGIVLDDGEGAIVSWLDGVEGQNAEIRLRRVEADGRMGEPLAISATRRSRASGFPRMVRAGGDLILAWTEAGEPSHVRAAALALAAVPAAPAGGAAVAPSEADRTAPRAWDGRSGSAAPDYGARAVEGGAMVSLADLRGAPVLVNFWATWCLPCREETADLIALHARYAQDGLRVIGVSVDEAASIDLVRRFVAQENIPYTVLTDPDDRASALFDLPMLPGTFLFDRGGVLVWSRQGVIDKDDPDLADAVRKALGRADR